VTRENVSVGDVRVVLLLVCYCFGEVSNGGDAGSGVAVLSDVQVAVMQSACGDLQI